MYLSHSKDDLTANMFSTFPAIPHLNIPSLRQAPRSGSSEEPLNENDKTPPSRGREFVCLIRGETDLSHQYTHFVPPPDAHHVGERAAILELIISKWRLSHADFTLEDHENMALRNSHLSALAHLLTCCSFTSNPSPPRQLFYDLHIRLPPRYLAIDCKMQEGQFGATKLVCHLPPIKSPLPHPIELIDDGHLDSGRAPSRILWEPTPLESFQRTFELVVLRPSHFLINGEPMSTYRDRVREHLITPILMVFCVTSTTISFPPFPCGVCDYLNPLFVNLAAVLRVRRFKRLNGGTFPPTFHPHACALMDAVLALHEEIIFTPKPNIPARERYLRLLRLRNEVSGGGGGGSSAGGGAGAGGDETGGSGNDHPVGMEGIESAGLPAQGSTRLPLSQRIASGDFDGDEFDQIFGGNDFLDLPALYDEDDDNDVFFPRPSTPVISVNEKIESWLFDSSAGQDSNGSNSTD